jgi:hypothetical protein
MDEKLKRALDTAKINCKNSIAIAYIDAMDEVIRLYGDKGINIQLLYILNNLTGWRGELARETKIILKSYITK